jgi:hypothetical protein
LDTTPHPDMTTLNETDLNRHPTPISFIEHESKM